MKLNKKLIKFISFALIAVFIIGIGAYFIITNDFEHVIASASKNRTNYSLDAVYAESDHSLLVKEKVDFYNETDSVLNDVCFHLYPKAFCEGASVLPYTELTKARCFPNGVSYADFKITSLKAENEPKPVTLLGEDKDILKVDLISGLAKKARTNIEIEFVLTLPNCTHRMGYFEDNVNLGNFYPIVCDYLESGEWDTTPYYATGDPFNSNVSNYSAVFSIPKDYNFASSGEVVSVTQNGENNVYNVNGLAIRDFALVLTKSNNILSDRIGNTTINYFAGEDDENARDYLTLACEAFFTYSSNFGEYPYKTLNIVKSPFMQGGMEYPNLIIASSLITEKEEYQKVIVHEIAHQWWYGVCGNNQVVDAWFDEGLSEFSTFLFFDQHPKYGVNMETLIEDAAAGYNLYLEVFNTINIFVNRKMNMPVCDYSSEYEYTYMVYVKGAIMFNEMNQTIGQKRFLKGLKKLYKTNKFGKVNAEKFCDAFGASKKTIEEILTKYLNGQSYLDI
ncbi:MAG: M1 family metallopeptidase [Clostridia bacterium]|nr:M1 family metallopeptidase [Clostridia bacterium]